MSTAVSVSKPKSAARARPLRVAHVNANFFAGAGGIMLREALALAGQGCSSTIVAPHDGTLLRRAEEGGLNIVRLDTLRGGRHPAASEVAALRELSVHLRAGRYDVVHTHGTKSGLLGRIAAHRVGVRAIVHTLHGFPFHEFQSPVTRAALHTMERRLGRVTDYFLTDGTFVASEAVRLKIAPPDRIRALISPIDRVPEVTPERRRRARQLLGLPQDAKVVGTTGRMVMQKAPLDMVEAFAVLNRPDLYMVWIGDGDLRRKTEKKIRAKGLDGRFLLMGERSDVPQLLPALDVFALSSLFEGLPCSLVEAMTCGIPVVASAVNSVPEIVLAGKTGIVSRPNDPASLASGIAYLLDHPQDAARMAAAARSHVGEQFRSDVLGEELLDVYETALRPPSRRRRRGS
jgi:glycosyltransferase involved in cell wall biosynthesis